MSILKEVLEVTEFEEGLKLMEEKFGNGKDNAISLATIACEPSENGNIRPVVRTVDAYYEDGTDAQLNAAIVEIQKQIAE